MEQLRGFEQNATRSSERVEESMRRGMNAFYTEFSNSLGGASSNLNRTADQSRRSGEKIAAAGETSAVGFKRLTGSLLEAYAVVGTLEGAFHKLEQGAARATSTVMTSLTTGIGNRELGGLAGMFPYTPFEQSFGAFQQMKSWAALWRAGQPPQQVLQALARFGGIAGVPTDTSQLGSVQGMLGQIAKIEQRLPVGMRGPFLQQLGLPQSWLPELLKNPAQIARDYDEAMKRAPTAEVTDELFRLEGQVRKTEQSWLTLWETIESSASKHGGMAAMEGLDQGLQKLNTWMSSTKQGAEALKDILTGLAIIIGVNMVRAIGKLVTAITGVVLPPWLAGLIAAYEVMKPAPLNEGEDKWLKQHQPPNTHWVPGLGWAPGAAKVGSLPGGPLSDAVKGGGAGSIADYIIGREGGSPSGVLNNPGNIKYTGAPGQIDSGIRAKDGGTFASYATPEAGRTAIIDLINRAASGGSRAYGANPTVQSFLNTYSGGGYGLSASVAHGVAASGSHVDVGNLSRISGLNAARAGANQVINIGSVVVNTAATDAKTIAKDVKNALARALATKNTSSVMESNTIFESIALFIIFGTLAAPFIMPAC